MVAILGFPVLTHPCWLISFLVSHQSAPLPSFESHSGSNTQLLDLGAIRELALAFRSAASDERTASAATQGSGEGGALQASGRDLSSEEERYAEDLADLAFDMAEFSIEVGTCVCVCVSE